MRARACARASEYRKKIYYILYINTILYYMLYYCTFTLFEGGDAFKQGSKKEKGKKKLYTYNSKYNKGNNEE